MTDIFIEKFRKKYSLPEADIRTLINKMQKVHFKKKEIIVREESKDTNLYFIIQGIWRGYYLKDGVETTIWFASTGEVAFSIWGYADNSNSHIAIESLCDSVAYYISRKELNKLYISSLALANFGRRLMEQNLLNIENWLLSSGNPRAKERYLTLIKENPELLKYVPLKYIASYLWVTPQSLSRIRSKIAF